MAFWGAEVEAGKSFSLEPTVARRLHISKATLESLDNRTIRNVLVCKVGKRKPFRLCVLSSGTVDSCNLNLEFEEADEVKFCVIGPLSIHITGYFLPTPTAFRLDDGETLARADDVQAGATPTAGETAGETLAGADDVQVGNNDATRRPKKRKRKAKREETADDVQVGATPTAGARADDVQAGATPTTGETAGETLARADDVQAGATPTTGESAGETLARADDLQVGNNDATRRPKKKRRKANREEVDCSDDKNVEKEAGTKKPPEPETSSNEVTIEEIGKRISDGKSAVNGKKVSILYTAMLKDTGKVFDSNLGEAPLRFCLGGAKVIAGLSIGVEGMRVGDKRRLTIPPSLGYAEEGLNEDVPKNAWLVYEVEAVKVR